MSLSTLPDFHAIRARHRADQDSVIQTLIAEAGIDADVRNRIQARAIQLIRDIRQSGEPGLMESFLAEYGLSTNEGIALMCLAEALLRVPDPGTMDELIEDKIAPHEWDDHLGQSQSSIVNASTMALMLTGRVIDEDNSASVMGLLNRTVKRLGEPVVRVAVRRAMKEMGDQFVLGQTIEEAIARGKREKKRGYLYSYDMLGEAALTAKQAQDFFDAYRSAVAAIGKTDQPGDISTSPGISVKLSALHPRFEYAKWERLEAELVPRLLDLARDAKARGLGLNVDAEEADRLEPTLKIVAAVLAHPDLEGWDGFGLVVQAYGKRASTVIDWYYELAKALDRKVMVRLVKGAYWDTEVKLAQVDGVPDFPVFTRRSATDISYIACAKKLLAMGDRIYPQFATHNAHTAATILELASASDTPFEFQRLHGMGETLHGLLLKNEEVRCRIYAPVGPHEDLLAYLVRRLLENGANSSFVNQIVDRNLTPEDIAQDPFERYQRRRNQPNESIQKPTDLFAPERINSRGWDLRNAEDIADYERSRAPYRTQVWTVEPLLAGPHEGDSTEMLVSPSAPSEAVSIVTWASEADVELALDRSRIWIEADGRLRAAALHRIADRFEQSAGEFFALLAREAGKTPLDAVAELREAVDFLRYYAARADQIRVDAPRGTIVCISPWNFPLAIFTGQIAAALAAGNAVIAKPAESTPAVAYLAVKLMLDAGVPKDVLQFAPGHGHDVGRALTETSMIAGVCFTGSTRTAQLINRALATSASPAAMLIAETGGLNAAVVDSTALPEQAVRHTISSAFQSAGQRCSAMRVLYLQEDVADRYLDILFGAMDELALADPWAFATDLGPVINETAQARIQAHIDAAKSDGRLLKQLDAPGAGYFVGPAVIELRHINELEEEIFGPVLHVVRFAADDYDQVLSDINATGYGLTFGLHTRIDDRVKAVSGQLDVGNIYVNRNQIGAIVGSQPFGGEGLSGTGPKAGGPFYVRRFQLPHRRASAMVDGTPVSLEAAQAALDAAYRPEPRLLWETELPGPTGELNTLSVWPRGLILCLGPTLEDAREQAGAARSQGCAAIVIAPGAKSEGNLSGTLPAECLSQLTGFDGVALWADDDDLRPFRKALADRDGPLLPLIATDNVEDYCVVERHVCIDTTAAGGNATLLAGG